MLYNAWRQRNMSCPHMPMPLPSHLSEAFDAAVELLAAGLPERHLVLSGGSVLQALWKHRTSTDLDFFVPEAALGEDRLIAPTYAVDLQGIPQVVANAVEQRNASLIPVAEPIPTFDGDDGDGAMGGGS